MKTPDYFQTLWGISAVDKITETPTSHLYKAQHNAQTCVLKIYTAHGKKCEADSGPFLQHINGNGCVNVIQGNEDALLLEYIDGNTLQPLILDGRDKEATEIIAATLHKIHSAPLPSQSFPTLNDRFESLFLHEQKGAPDIINHGAHLARQALKENHPQTLLHGDMHHENIMQCSNQGWVAIDPQPCIGDPAYDCANTLHNPHQMFHLTEDKDRLLMQANIFGDRMGIDPQRIINYAFIHGCLSACWAFDDDGESFENSPSIRTSETLKNYITLDKHHE